MQIKKLLMTSIASCLLMSVVVAAAQSNMVSPASLWQRNSCTMDGAPASDIDLMNGEAKTVNCVWENGDAGLQLTLHAGQLAEVQASCKFAPAENRHDGLGAVEGAKGASIRNLNIHANPITFTVMNDTPGQDLNVQFILNSGQTYKDIIYRKIHGTTSIDYNPGATMTCTFTPLGTVKG